MFGTDEQNQQSSSQNKPQAADSTSPTGGTSSSQTGTVFNPAGASMANPTVGPATAATGAPGAPPPPPVFAQPVTANDDVTSSPAAGPAASTEPAQTPAAASAPPLSPGQQSDLITIKQQALQSLTPLVDDLELSPEDKFKTMMMLIQASDNSELVKKAYDTATTITDEKVRAQALLDVVNEINYFTQKPQPNS